MNPRLVLALVLVTASTAAMEGCKRPDAAGDGKPEAAAQAEVAAIPAAHFARVTERRLPATLEASGTLAADETSEVASPGSGVCTSVEIDVGSYVKKGDPLVRLDGRDASLRLAQANAAAAQAQARLGTRPGERFDPGATAEVRAAKEAMDLAVADAARTKSLFDSGGVAQAAWDQARARAEQARAQYDGAQSGAQQAWAGLAAAQASANLAQKAAGDTIVRAPFDGAVAERRISVGEFAQMGRVVAVVVRDNPLRLRVDIPESDSARVTLGKDVTITVAAFPTLTFHGAVKRIGASMKAQSRALPIEIEVPNSNGSGSLKPGSFARAQIVLDGGDAAVLFVPKGAVGTSGSASRVFVRVGNRVSERIVTVGREIEGLTEVKGTLTAADEIAVDAIDKLSDGAEIKVIP
ncbi:MAG: efflux RND transporter periplasmic adaptor subunit [Byssovorax sp.]